MNATVFVLSVSSMHIYIYICMYTNFIEKFIRFFKLFDTIDTMNLSSSSSSSRLRNAINYNNNTKIQVKLEATRNYDIPTISLRCDIPTDGNNVLTRMLFA